MYTKLDILKAINQLEPIALSTEIAKKIDCESIDNLNDDLEILVEEKLISKRFKKVGVFISYELTIKGFEYINTSKLNSYRFWLPIIISSTLSVFAILISLISLLKVCDFETASSRCFIASDFFNFIPQSLLFH